MIAPVLARNRDKIFLAGKSEARDYEGFKRDLNRSLQVLRTDCIDLYDLHDMQPHELVNVALKPDSGLPSNRRHGSPSCSNSGHGVKLARSFEDEHDLVRRCSRAAELNLRRFSFRDVPR
jgi:aryl-alcohol dehydrogenase-like predicted oxidoreductase